MAKAEKQIEWPRGMTVIRTHIPDRSQEVKGLMVVQRAPLPDHTAKEVKPCENSAR